MKTQEKSNKSWLLGVIAAMAASLCCITPLLALLGGLGGIASSFSWLDPFRPYLVGFTVLIFGFAWFQKLKPKKTDEIDCDCEENEKVSFWQSKTFLGTVTVTATLLVAFPYYSGAFFPDNSNTTIIVKEQNIIEAKLTIEGMTCTGCEHGVNYALNEQQGVIEATSSYKEGIAIVKFDKTLVSVDHLSEAITEATGYKVTEHEFINQN